LLGLARFYDPADTAPKGSIRPDPEQACVWYNKAKDKGQSAADDKLTALRAWAEAEKDTNPQAKSLLESWK
jgi:TPR repeat protein